MKITNKNKLKALGIIETIMFETSHEALERWNKLSTKKQRKFVQKCESLKWDGMSILQSHIDKSWSEFS